MAESVDDRGRGARLAGREEAHTALMQLNRNAARRMHGPRRRSTQPFPSPELSSAAKSSPGMDASQVMWLLSLTSVTDE